MKRDYLEILEQLNSASDGASHETSLIILAARFWRRSMVLEWYLSPEQLQLGPITLFLYGFWK